MSDYLLRHGTVVTPQSEPLTDDQVENSAGGFVWEVDIWSQLKRFLILGSEGGSYYATERDLTTKNVKSIKKCVSEDGVRTVNEIVQISDSGRAPKNDPALYALAVCISLGDKETKRAAAEALPKVARIGTHLYHFVAYAETMRGWGRTMRWAISNWYAKNPEQLALQAVKYRQRDGWSHRDLLRLAHPKNDDNAMIFDWIVRGADSITEENEEIGIAHGAIQHPMIAGFELAQRAKTPKETAGFVRQFNLPREALNTDHLNDKVVWEAMLEMGMPLGALTRNLATMTRNGVLESAGNRKLVLEALANKEAIHKSRLHPLALLVAQRTYAAGHGFRSQNTWAPIPDVIDALDEAFYLAFGNVESTGKNILLALDVSGSMDGGQVCESPLTPREAGAAMALVTLHAEPNVEIVGFHCGAGGWASPFESRFKSWHNIDDGLTPLGISRRQRLDDVVRMTQALEMGGTDCSLPYLYAIDNNKHYDAFVTYTDSETWAGNIHPKEALDRFRNRSGRAAKSVVVSMVPNNFSLADPNDRGMIDVVGLDSATPSLISGFIAGAF